MPRSWRLQWRCVSLLALLVFAAMGGYFAWWRAQVVVPVGRFRTYAFFRSRHVPSRMVTVYLPPGYDAERSRRYPVLYLQNGLWVFADARPFPGATWQVDRIADRLIKRGEIEPLIIVAVASVPGRRDDEYTYWRDASARDGGDGASYAAMLTEELKPFVDAHFRTLPDATDTAIGGSSLGGLFALSTALRNPSVFGKVAALSPSVWWGGDTILRDISALPGSATRLTVYLSAGTAEPRIASGTRRLADALKLRRGGGDPQIRYDLVTGAGHSVTAWRDRVAPMLRFLFSSARHEGERHSLDIMPAQRYIVKESTK